MQTEETQREPLEYLSGFGNEHSTEALRGALPVGQNSPQQCPYGLYAEQLSGSAFTAPRAHNKRSWLYRVRPSVLHRSPAIRRSREAPLWLSAHGRAHLGADSLPLGPYRWAPPSIPSAREERQSFVKGVRTYTTAGSVDSSTGISVHLYVMNAAMRARDGRPEYLVNADAELLIVPQRGALEVITELGILEVKPGEIAVIPRGVLAQINPNPTLDDPRCRGYLCENYGAPFELPQLGPLGANGLANPRDFLSPVAHFMDDPKLDEPSVVWTRWGGDLYHSEIPHCPIDVVAWHGNYAPYKYDLKRFCTVGSISFDHPDPSIFTVLTSPSTTPGVANVDFVIFPDRWMVAEHTFRPPWYHRNLMSEFMGLIEGVYDAKEEGFKPGGASLHNLMVPHGPDAFGFAKATEAELNPQKLSGTLAFMFETRAPQHVTQYAASSFTLERDYADCWSQLKRHFNGDPHPYDT